MYGSNRPASSARESRLLSIPKRTSPCGFPFVSSARLTISPASPPWRIVSFSPLSCSNAAFTSRRDRERVVRDEHDLLAAAAPRAAARRCDERGADDDQRRPDFVPNRHKDSSRFGGRADGQQAAARDGDARFGGGEDVRDPAARAGRQGLVAERVLEPLGRDALRRRRAAGSRERSSPGRSRERARAADDVRLRRAEPGVDRHARVALVREQQQRAEQVVEPAAARRRSRGSGTARARARRRARARDRSRPWRPGVARRARRPPRRRRARPA